MLPTTDKYKANTRDWGKWKLSEAVIVAIIGAIAATISVVLGTLVALQNNKLKAQELTLTNHTAEQARQKETITRLADEATSRQLAREQERKEDRLDQQQLIDSLKQASDFYRDRWQAEAVIANEQRAEIKGLTQQSIDAYKQNDVLQREFTKADQAHSDDIVALKKKTAELEAMTTALNKAHETIERQQLAFDKMTDKFDADIKKINETNTKIIEKLQLRITALEDENRDLKQELARIRKLVGPDDYSGIGAKPPDDDPTPPPQPGANAPLPFEDKPSALLPTGTGG